jgi:hypothetical protein
VGKLSHAVGHNRSLCLCLVEEDPSCLFEGLESLVVEAGIGDVYNKCSRDVIYIYM